MYAATASSPPSASSSPQRSSGHSGDVGGRVVRLHFRCHAELPIGSFLRVTGSTLWAPGSQAADPADAVATMGLTEQSAFSATAPAVGGAMEVASEDSDAAMNALYTSSIEMVTTPEDYPIWWTRKPVVVVIHNAKKTIQHHYYRYLVVSPGGSGPVEVLTDDDNALLISTSSEVAGSTAVMQWEDPFGTLLKEKAAGQLPTSKGELSAVSLASSITVAGQVTRSDYRNLPYRTVDIDVKTGMPIMEDTDEAVRLDRWNFADDASFRAYRIREAVRYLSDILLIALLRC